MTWISISNIQYYLNKQKFSILPDNDSDRGDSENEKDNQRGRHNLWERSEVSRRKTSHSQSRASNETLQKGFSDYSEISPVSMEELEEEKKSVPKPRSKKKALKGNKQGTLRMYDGEPAGEDKTTLPSKDELKEIALHLRLARDKLVKAWLRVVTYVAVKSLAVVVIIIQLILLCFKYIWQVLSQIFYHLMRFIFSCFPFLNSLLLHQHDRKDPFKRTVTQKSGIEEKSGEEVTLQDKESLWIDDINRKIFWLALDLDETLVYTVPFKEGASGQQERVNVIHPMQKQEQIFTLIRRPYLDCFLEEMSKWFNLIVYSSAQRQYVDAIVDKIDTHKLISRRLYRDHCIKCPGIYIKDLQHVGDIQQTIILDTLTEATKLDSDNALIIPKFRGQDQDQELLSYSKILSFIAANSIKRNISLQSSLHQFREAYL